MDVSKLPRLSNTDPPPIAPHDPGATPAPQPVMPAQAAPATVDPANAWFSIGVGVILLFLSPRILKYVFARSSFDWTFNDAQGNPLAYPQTVFFWGDLALLAFALVLIVEGVMFAIAPRRPVLIIAFALSVLSTLLNLGYLVYMMSGYGFQIMAALAVIFGVYIAAYQWKLINPGPSAPRA